MMIVHCKLAQCLELFHEVPLSQWGLEQLAVILAAAAASHHLALHGMERMGVAALLLVPTARVLEECGCSLSLGRKDCTYVELVVVGWAHVAPAARRVVVVQPPAL